MRGEDSVPDGGRLGCADHNSASRLEGDLEAVGLDGGHLGNVLETEEVHDLRSDHNVTKCTVRARVL